MKKFLDTWGKLVLTVIMLVVMVSQFIGWVDAATSCIVIGICCIVHTINGISKCLSTLLIVIGILNIMLGVSLYYSATNDGWTPEVTAKTYMIEHSEDIRAINIDDYEHGYSHYKVDTCLLNYWDEITIKDYCDSMYVIMWGDRDSWQWRLRRDKGMWIYLESNDTLDNKMFDIIDNLRDDGETLENVDTLSDTLCDDEVDVMPMTLTTIEATTHTWLVPADGE